MSGPVFSWVEVRKLHTEAMFVCNMSSDARDVAAGEVVCRFLMRPTQKSAREKDPDKFGDAHRAIDTKVKFVRDSLPKLEETGFKETGTNTDLILGYLVWLLDAAREERVAFDRLKPLVRDLLRLKNPPRMVLDFAADYFDGKIKVRNPTRPRIPHDTRRDAQGYFIAAALIKNGFSNNGAFTIVADAFAKCGMMFAQYSKENRGKNLPGNIRSCYEKGKRKYGASMF